MVLTWGVWVGTREVYSPETVVTTYGKKWYPTHGGLEEKMHLYIISCSFRAVFFLKVLIDLAEVCWGDARGQGL